MTNNCGKVVACIPYFRCQKYIRRSVVSLLGQTYKDIVVVVLNDADLETPPWPMLSDIRDSRLIRFDLSHNRGPYFASQVLLSASRYPYFLVQDADDFSHTERVALLLQAMTKD